VGIICNSPRGTASIQQLSPRVSQARTGAYIAAQLNLLNGASIPSDVQTLLDNATAPFGMYTPDEIGALSGGDDLRKRFVRMGETLDDYNDGLIGPGHCDEDGNGDGDNGGVCD
jgi:hypothetical protein